MFMGTWLKVIPQQLAQSNTTKDTAINDCTVFPMYLGTVLYGYENNKNKALYTYQISDRKKYSAIDYALYSQSNYFRIYTDYYNYFNYAFTYSYSNRNINIPSDGAYRSVETVNTGIIKKGKYKYVTKGELYNFVLPFSCVINNKSYKYIHAYNAGTFALINDENIPVYPSLNFRNDSSQLFIKVNDIIEYEDIFNIGLPEPFVDWFNSHFQRIYENIYTIKSVTDETLATLTKAPPMISATLTAVGNAKYLTLKGENNTNYTMEWTSETPQGKIFAGLATSKGGSIAIPVGETSTINFTESTDLYEVWQTYRPPTTMFDINLYKNSSEPNKVDKTADLSTVGTISGVLRQECSLINPEIIIQYDKPPDFNYCYIANFGRYYYVENIVSMRQNLWRVRLRCDVLMTYKTQILNLNARIARQQYTYSYRQIDSEIPFTNDPEITVVDIPNKLKLGKQIDQNILLTVVDNGI